MITMSKNEGDDFTHVSQSPLLKAVVDAQQRIEKRQKNIYGKKKLIKKYTKKC